MNEQILKRLQDSLKMLSVCLEQMEEVGWLFKDIIGDLELECSKCNTASADQVPIARVQENQTKQNQDVKPQ